MLGEQHGAAQGNYPAQASIATLVPTKSDAERATDIRADMTGKLEPICRAMDAAKRDGFEVTFQLAKDGNGRQFVSTLVIAKHF